MAKISLNYPQSGLSISISVKNRDTGVEAFAGSMIEVGVTGVYTYDFTEVADTDYIYTASTTGYDNLNGVLYRDLLAKTTDVTTAITEIKGLDDKDLTEVFNNTPTIDFTGIARTSDITSAVTNIKGNDNKDLTQVYNNTPTIDNEAVAEAVRVELEPELLDIVTIKELEEADEEHTPTTIIKKHKTSKNIILQKIITGSNLIDNITITE